MTPRSAIGHATGCVTGPIVAYVVNITITILACALDLGVKGQFQILKIDQNLSCGSKGDPRFRCYGGRHIYHNDCSPVENQNDLTLDFKGFFFLYWFLLLRHCS